MLGMKHARSPCYNKFIAHTGKQRLRLPVSKVVLTRSHLAGQPDSRAVHIRRHTAVVPSVTRATATESDLQTATLREDETLSPDIPQRASSDNVHPQQALDAMPVLSLEKSSVMIWGANTGVGKTLVSAGLTVALLSRRGQNEDEQGKQGSDRNQDGGRSLHVEYLKPVQTGYPEGEEEL